MDMIHRFGDAMMTGIVNSQRSLHQASLLGVVQINSSYIIFILSFFSIS